MLEQHILIFYHTINGGIKIMKFQFYYLLLLLPFAVINCTQPTVDENSIHISGTINDKSTGQALHKNIVIYLNEDLSSFMGPKWDDIIDSFYTNSEGEYDISLITDTHNALSLIIRSIPYKDTIINGPNDTIYQTIDYISTQSESIERGSEMHLDFYLAPITSYLIRLNTDNLLANNDSLRIQYPCYPNTYIVDYFTEGTSAAQTIYRTNEGDKEYIFSWAIKRENGNWLQSADTVFCTRFVQYDISINY